MEPEEKIYMNAQAGAAQYYQPDSVRHDKEAGQSAFASLEEELARLAQMSESLNLTMARGAREKMPLALYRAVKYEANKNISKSEENVTLVYDIPRSRKDVEPDSRYSKGMGDMLDLGEYDIPKPIRQIRKSDI